LCPTEGAGGSGWGEKDLGISAQTVAPEALSQISGRK